MTRHKRQRPLRGGSEEGVALMVVLLFVVLLGAIVMEFSYETQVDASLMSNSRAEFEAFVAAKSAVAVGMGELQMDLLTGQMQGGATTGGATNSGRTTNRATGRAANAMMNGEQLQDVDSFLDVWAMQGIPRAPLNDAEMMGMIVDECGKMNLNALVSVDPTNGEPIVNETMVNALHAFFEYLQVEEDPTDAIVDWIDPDEDTGQDGAESDYYESLETPYSCPNTRMKSIEELLLIRGITPELYFDLNLDPSEQEQRIEEGEMPLSLPDLLTVHGSEQGQINVNTAHPELLRALSNHAGIQVDAIDRWVAMRVETPAQDPNEAADALGVTNAEVKGAFTVSSNCFRIRGDGISGKSMVRIEAFVARAPSQVLADFGVGGGSSGNQQGLEVLRVLDWRVIR